MSFSQTVKRAWNDDRLLSVLLELTYACNLDCSFCYNDLSLDGTPLSLAQYEQLLADLAAMNVLNVTLSGGEPLAHPGFFRIGGIARELGFVVRIKTNGHAVNRARAQRIRDEIDPFMVEVSLHGTTASVHDRQTRVAGSFDRLIRNIGGMRSAGLRVKVNSTLTRWNEHQLEALFALCDSLGVMLQVDPEVKPKDDGDREPLSLAASQQGLDRLNALLATRARLRRDEGQEPDPLPPEEYRKQVFSGTDKHCGAGASTVAIDPFGSVLPCVQWRVPVGDLHEKRIGEIWSTAPGLARARETTREARRMIDGYGDAGQRMNFCPGAAHTHSGDPLALYPAAKQRMTTEARTRVRLPVV